MDLDVILLQLRVHVFVCVRVCVPKCSTSREHGQTSSACCVPFSPRAPSCRLFLAGLQDGLCSFAVARQHVLQDVLTNSSADYSQAAACLLLVSWYSSPHEIYKGTELFWSQCSRKSMEEGFLFSEEGGSKGQNFTNTRAAGNAAGKRKKKNPRCSIKLMWKIQSLSIFENVYNSDIFHVFSWVIFCFSLLFSDLVGGTVHSNRWCCQIKIMGIQKSRTEPQELIEIRPGTVMQWSVLQNWHGIPPAVLVVQESYLLSAKC